MRTGRRTVTTPGEAAVIMGICFGLSIVISIHAVLADFPSSPFSDNGLMWLAGTDVLLAFAALVVLFLRGYAIGTLLPVPTLKGCLQGVGLFVAAWIAGLVLTLPFANQPEQPYVHMIEDARVTVPVIVVMAMVNGAFEEVFLLGFLLRGLRGFGLSIALGAMLLVRVLYHLYQGPVGAVWVLAIGLVFGLYFMRTNQLWPPVFAHILWDIVPFLSE
jgi:membrane protease YdiL (CAAX protease family)